jgi:hypothetical protein
MMRELQDMQLKKVNWTIYRGAVRIEDDGDDAMVLKDNELVGRIDPFGKCIWRYATNPRKLYRTPPPTGDIVNLMPWIIATATLLALAACGAVHVWAH